MSKPHTHLKKSSLGTKEEEIETAAASQVDDQPEQQNEHIPTPKQEEERQIKVRRADLAKRKKKYERGVQIQVL